MPVRDIGIERNEESVRWTDTQMQGSIGPGKAVATVNAKVIDGGSWLWRRNQGQPWSQMLNAPGAKLVLGDRWTNVCLGWAVVVGHDWGAPVAWNTALFRPDRVRGVVGLSVPYRPRGARPPLSILRSALGEEFYQIYFQQPGVAEADFERDFRQSVRRALYGASGENPIIPNMMIRAGLGFFGEIVVPERLPTWLTGADVNFYTAEFSRTGFAGGLNWYRNIDRNWELTAPWQGAKVTPPALYVVGDRDIVYHFPRAKEAASNLPSIVPNLTRTVVLEGCGHWTQQERPEEVNRALIAFLEGLPEET
jgi:pimeloyl-ACP methyl ester carboxylesterase